MGFFGFLDRRVIGEQERDEAQTDVRLLQNNREPDDRGEAASECQMEEAPSGDEEHRGRNRAEDKERAEIRLDRD